jgi:hypothetical protein
MRRERLAAAIPLVLLVALVSPLYPADRPAAGGTFPRCSWEGYGLEARTVPLTAHRENAVKLTMGWLTAKERRRACQVRTTIKLAIIGTGGVAVSAHWNLNAVLRPWSAVVHSWVWRNWCEAEGVEPVAVEVSVPSGITRRQDIADPPACVNVVAPSTVADLGTGTKYVPRPGDRIPPHMLPKGTPSPLHEVLIKVRNAWLVSDGYTLVAVYAGSAGLNHSTGRFAIIRQNLIFGIQYERPDFVDVRNAGALRITGAPRGAASETTAQHGQLVFGSARGTRGVLELAGDHVRITRR